MKYETPKTLNTHDMFMWWCKQKIRNKRHLRIKNYNSNAFPTILVSRNSDELDWLRKNVLVLAEQIEALEKVDNIKYYFTNATKDIYRMKRELYEGNERIKHLEQVDGSSEQVIMSMLTFKNVLLRYNKEVRDSLINNASVLNMKKYLGYLHVERIDRYKSGNKSTKSLRMPNWGASNTYKKELIEQGIQIKDKEHPDGKKWMVFYEDDHYLRLAWKKSHGACKVKNHNYYKFVPSGGIVGVKNQLRDANNANPYLMNTYLVDGLK